MIALTSQNSQDFESPGQNMALHRCSHLHTEQSVPCQLIVKVSTRKRFVQGPCESTGALAQSALRHDRDDIEACGATRHASRRGGPIAAAHSMCIDLVHLTAVLILQYAPRGTMLARGQAACTPQQRAFAFESLNLKTNEHQKFYSSIFLYQHLRIKLPYYSDSAGRAVKPRHVSCS